MNIRIEKLDDYTNRELFDRLAAWDNDSDIRPFITPGMNEGDDAGVSGEELMYHAHENKTKHIYLAYDKDKLIGTYSIDTDFEHRVHKTDKTAWIGIVIGDKSYWGKGVGQQMMEDLEIQCKALGCAVVELGVFEYNRRAIGLYRSLGYEIIDVIDNFVYYQGRWHSDIRMLKRL